MSRKERQKLQETSITRSKANDFHFFNQL